MSQEGFFGGFPAVPKPNQLLRFAHVKAWARNAKSPRWEVLRKVLLTLASPRVPHVFPGALSSFSFPAFGLLALETGKGFFLQAGELWSGCWLRETEFLSLLP